jgi:hypothetical protein
VSFILSSKRRIYTSEGRVHVEPQQVWFLWKETTILHLPLTQAGVYIFYSEVLIIPLLFCDGEVGRYRCDQVQKRYQHNYTSTNAYDFIQHAAVIGTRLSVCGTTLK